MQTTCFWRNSVGFPAACFWCWFGSLFCLFCRCFGHRFGCLFKVAQVHLWIEQHSRSQRCPALHLDLPALCRACCRQNFGVHGLYLLIASMDHTCNDSSLNLSSYHNVSPTWIFPKILRFSLVFQIPCICNILNPQTSPENALTGSKHLLTRYVVRGGSPYCPTFQGEVQFFDLALTFIQFYHNIDFV